MLKALVPVDGSRNSMRAVRHVISLVEDREPMEIHLLNVQEAADAWEVRRFLTASEVRRQQVAHGRRQLKGAESLLDRAGLKYKSHVVIGDVPATISRFAKRLRCDKIIMGTRGMGTVANLILGSVATKVIHLAAVPVTLVK
jgi:nucleotide-binding universal stress UspA family protein